MTEVQYWIVCRRGEDPDVLRHSTLGSARDLCRILGADYAICPSPAMRHVDRKDLLAKLGFTGERIPADANFEQWPVTLVDRWHGTVCVTAVVVRPLARRSGRKSSTHRVLAKCPECGHLIPVGRLHQHRGTRKCSR